MIAQTTEVATVEEQRKQIAMLKKTLSRCQLSLDQVRKALADVESRLDKLQDASEKNRGGERAE